MFENLFGGTEQRTQLFFRDDGSFEFRKLPFEDACLVERKDNNIVRAWKHFYNNEFLFNGYKKVKADMVTLGFNRDIILDPFNTVPERPSPNSGKPLPNETSIKKWTGEVAESQRYKAINKPGNMLIWDKITMFLGIALLLMVIAFLIARVT